jgi:predicted RNase H-like nuclease (RuvC/YqgF family)
MTETHEFANNEEDPSRGKAACQNCDDLTKTLEKYQLIIKQMISYKTEVEAVLEENSKLNALLESKQVEIEQLKQEKKPARIQEPLEGLSLFTSMIQVSDRRARLI